jgi:hypothetical protein
MPIRRGRGMLWSTNAAVAAVASCCCVVMNLCYQVSHGPFCVASSTELLKLVMLLKNHISAAIRDKYEEAARWLLYTYPSYIFSLSAGHMGSCSSTSLFFCSSTGGLEFANFDNRSASAPRILILLLLWAAEERHLIPPHFFFKVCIFCCISCLLSTLSCAPREFSSLIMLYCSSG